ncbi:MAG TPA: acyltransferase [Solirubrobacterales bacterium]|nr:acyltransferase [Solirubrobacterales bacterium]
MAKGVVKGKGPALRSAEREAGTVLPPPPRNPRFPLFDPLRAVAATAILLVHVGLFTGGFEPIPLQLFSHLDIGVPFFFLISGFLLYRPFLAARHLEAPAVRNRDYARNRFFRIFPLYWVVLTITAIVPGMYGAFTGDWWVYYGLLQNFPVYTAGQGCLDDPFTCAIPPAWTLTLEVGFYILLPFLAAGIAGLTRLFGRNRWVAVNLGVFAAISVASVFIQADMPDGAAEQWLFFSPLARGWWFALGMIFATLSVLHRKTGRIPPGVNWLAKRPGTAWLTAGLLYAGMTFVLLDPVPTLNYMTTSRFEYLSQYLLDGVIVALLALPAVFARPRALPERLLMHPVPVYLGLISYGIFLWHFPVMVGLARIGVGEIWPAMSYPLFAMASFAVTVALAAITYRLVERPMMTWSRRRGTGRAGDPEASVPAAALPAAATRSAP